MVRGRAVGLESYRLIAPLSYIRGMMPVGAEYDSLPRAARWAFGTALLLATIGAYGVASGSPGALLTIPIFVIGGIGIRRRRVWSAYGLALFLSAQLVSLAIPWVREAFTSGGMTILVVILYLGLTLLFLRAGRSLASAGSPRGHAAGWVILAAVTALGCLSFLFVQPLRNRSGGMEDTVAAGDSIFVRRKPGAAVRRGDIMVFRYPVDRRQVYIKRVVGAPGDRIKLVRKALYLNGAPLVEPYVVHRTSYFDDYRDSFPSIPGLISLPASARDMLAHHLVNGEIVVPDGNYFVLGDNRDNSSDSRYWGFVPALDVIGKPVLIYWSLQPPAESLTRPKPWEGTVRWNRIFKPI
jgi:signal peptidase I